MTYCPWDPNNDQPVQKVKSALMTSRVLSLDIREVCRDGGRGQHEGDQNPAMQILVLTKQPMWPEAVLMLIKLKLKGPAFAQVLPKTWEGPYQLIHMMIHFGKICVC